MPGELTQHALAQLRRLGQHLHDYVYVIDSAQRLVGVLTVRELLQAPAGPLVGTLMHRDVHVLSTDDSESTVRAHPAWDEVHALPVVDAHRVLVGILHYRTLRRLQRQSLASSPVEAAVHTLASFGEIWWDTVASMADITEAWSRHRAGRGRSEDLRARSR